MTHLVISAPASHLRCAGIHLTKAHTFYIVPLTNLPTYPHPTTPMKIACLLITYLRAKIEIRRHPDLKNKPAVIIERSGGKSWVVDSTPLATGVRRGLTLQEALSIRPDTLVIEADEPHYRRVFDQVLTSLQQISDRVEGTDPGTAYIRLDGLEHLYGGEARLVNALLNAVPRDQAPRVGVAEVKFSALVAATISEPSGATRVPADTASFLAPHSVELLPVSPELKIALHRFGLHTLGNVASMPEATLMDRFGAEGRRAWLLSQGTDDSPLVPLDHAETIVERTSLPFSSASLDLLLTVVDTLLTRALSRPSMRGRYAGKAILQCTLERGTTWVREIAFKGGVGNRERALSIIRPLLDHNHPTDAIEEVTLTLDDLTGESGTQMGLIPDVREVNARRLADVERDLQTRLGGATALYRMVGVAPWHPAPEMRSLRVPVDSSSRDQVRPMSSPVPVVVRESREQEPEAVQWNNSWRKVSRIDERWGFDLWWMSRPMTRTYYRVRGDDGVEVTLFRDERGGCWYRQNT